MPRISTFMYCEGAGEEITPDGQKRLHIIGPMHILNPVFVPGTLNFSVIFGLLGVDTRTPHTLQITFKKQGSQELIVNTNQITIPISNEPINERLPVEHQGLMANLGFQNVIFRSEGLYEAEVLFDNDSLGVFPIYVVAKEILK